LAPAMLCGGGLALGITCFSTYCIYSYSTIYIELIFKTA
jgi:hypothetical protein